MSTIYQTIAFAKTIGGFLDLPVHVTIINTDHQRREANQSCWITKKTSVINRMKSLGDIQELEKKANNSPDRIFGQQIGTKRKEIIIAASCNNNILGYILEQLLLWYEEVGNIYFHNYCENHQTQKDYYDQKSRDEEANKTEAIIPRDEEYTTYIPLKGNIFKKHTFYPSLGKKCELNFTYIFPEDLAEFICNSEKARSLGIKYQKKEGEIVSIKIPNLGKDLSITISPVWRDPRRT